ncbi:hypothetical protein OAS86_06635 [Gammaproteobacteria bacterium]|nr:hypothetical protein [Gammaproteobacteria bacterium]
MDDEFELVVEEPDDVEELDVDDVLLESLILVFPLYYCDLKRHHKLNELDSP